MKSLEHIEAFLVLSECGSFTDAARRLYCSQPTVTNKIQKLEDSMGTKLFDRSGKSVRLTPQGEVFLQYARQVDRLMEEAATFVKEAAERETLSVYASVYISNYFFSEILDRVSFELPKQAVEIYTYCYDDLKRALGEGRTRFAFMPFYPEDEYLRTQYDYTELFEEEFRLILPPDHEWASRKMLFGRDLNGSRMLLPGSSYLQNHVGNLIRQSGIRAHYLQMSNFELIRQAVKSHLGIAFLPQSVIEEDIGKGELIVRSVAGLTVKRSNGIVMHKKNRLTRSEAAFCRIALRRFHKQDTALSL